MLLLLSLSLLAANQGETSGSMDETPDMSHSSLLQSSHYSGFLCVAPALLVRLQIILTVNTMLRRTAVCFYNGGPALIDFFKSNL